ncbi:MAG: outer membrane lipoprotein-sorting protein [Treponema sp.]|nr:outer membrane lipoprotein-sorting protein [Treponema sp.]
MKKNIVCYLYMFMAVAVLPAQDDAAAIVKASRDRISAKTVSTRSRMVITAKNGNTSERVIDQYSKDSAQGAKRTIIVFQKPQSVAGTRFLTIENTGRPNDQWIYMNELGKIRRIASSEGGGSFMGTDFSYDDIASTSRNVALDTHRMLREESLNGRLCYVIESIPKDSSYQYTKMILWIDTVTTLLYKIELYGKRNTPVKQLEMSNYQDVQGRITAKQTRMTTLASGTYTTLYIDIIKYDDNIPESVFTTTYLETGKY